MTNLGVPRLHRGSLARAGRTGPPPSRPGASSNDPTASPDPSAPRCPQGPRRSSTPLSRSTAPPRAGRLVASPLRPVRRPGCSSRRSRPPRCSSGNEARPGPPPRAVPQGIARSPARIDSPSDVRCDSGQNEHLGTLMSALGRPAGNALRSNDLKSSQPVTLRSPPDLAKSPSLGATGSEPLVRDRRHGRRRYRPRHGRCHSDEAAWPQAPLGPIGWCLSVGAAPAESSLPPALSGRRTSWPPPPQRHRHWPNWTRQSQVAP